MEASLQCRDQQCFGTSRLSPERHFAASDPVRASKNYRPVLSLSTLTYGEKMSVLIGRLVKIKEENN